MVAEPSGEEPGREPGRRGVGTLRSPHGREADSWLAAPVCKTGSSGRCRFDTCPAHHVLVAQRIERQRPKLEVGRSNRPEGTTTRISLESEAGCNPVLGRVSTWCSRYGGGTREGAPDRNKTSWRVEDRRLPLSMDRLRVRVPSSRATWV
jgi:hypothetical protein